MKANGTFSHSLLRMHCDDLAGSGVVGVLLTALLGAGSFQKSKMTCAEVSRSDLRLKSELQAHEVQQMRRAFELSRHTLLAG